MADKSLNEQHMQAEKHWHSPSHHMLSSWQLIGPSASDAMARMAALTSNGLVLYACSTVFLTGMGLAAKVAGNEGVPLFEMVLIRSLILTAMTCPPLLRGRTNPFKGERCVPSVLADITHNDLLVSCNVLPYMRAWCLVDHAAVLKR